MVFEETQLTGINLIRKNRSPLLWWSGFLGGFFWGRDLKCNTRQMVDRFVLSRRNSRQMVDWFVLSRRNSRQMVDRFVLSRRNSGQMVDWFVLSRRNSRQMVDWLS